MTGVPLGIGAYKRNVAGNPEVKLENRYVEKSPTNLQEHLTLLARPGTTLLTATMTGGVSRGHYTLQGLFNSDIFSVQGPKLWRRSAGALETQIATDIYGTGHPYTAWMKGEGYEYFFISDGLRLRYYNGGSRAVGTLTSSGTITTQVVQIGNDYFSWHATNVDTGPPDGTSTNPWLALKGVNAAASLVSLANLIKFAGVPGVDFSTALPGPSTLFTATSDATHLYVTALSSSAPAIATTIFSGSNLAWGAAALAGGGTHALVQVETPEGVEIKALAQLASFVLASVGNSRKVFFIRPGEVTIDALDFFEKESSPDDVEDMLTVGDQVLIAGKGSSEWWYATGDNDAPFAPTKGLAFQRGILPGTAVVVDDTAVIVVGDDNIVYKIAAGGATPISDEGITERVRTQVRREAGL